MSSSNQQSHLRSDWLRLVAVTLGGVLAGVAAKAADESTTPGASDLGTYFGAWVVLVTLVSTWSRSYALAAMQGVVFLLAMLCGYYAYARWLGFVVPTVLVLVWVLVVLLLAPPFAVLVRNARGSGWIAAAGAAVPVGILLAEAFTFVHVLSIHGIQFAFDLVSAAALFVLLPRTAMQRLRMLALTPIVAVVATPMLDRLWEVAARAM